MPNDDAYSDPWNQDDPYAQPLVGGGAAAVQAPVTWGQMNPPTNVEGGWNDPHTGGFVPENSGNKSGYMDLSYWASRGVPADQIMDFSTGQPRPGWARTGNGYEKTGQTETPYNPAGGPPLVSKNGGGGGVPTTMLGGGGSGYGGAMDWQGGPQPNYPAYQPAPPFMFDPFTPSSWEDAENEPGYAASRTNLRKQIEAGAAYRGMVRSGMTIGDIYSNLDALSQQNFKSFDDRRFRNWGGNLGLARTKHDYTVQDIDRANNYRFNVADQSFKGEIEKWRSMVDSLTAMSRPVE